jgi:glycosyltransferase involved in cell wall biosynthesis
VDTDHFSPRENPPEDGPRIVSNRKLEDVYSVDTVVDAFPGVHELFPSATLTVAGDGRLRTELGRRAERSIASGSIMFVGAVDHYRMPTLLGENHIYVSMSLSDTTSVSLLEAMACGLFPIVSDIPANREWIVGGENGMLVPVRQPMRLATSIVQAWRDRDLMENARRRNVDIIRERATWRENMRPVGDLFDRLVNRNE